jgi:hypothetical protein
MPTLTWKDDKYNLEFDEEVSLMEVFKGAQYIMNYIGVRMASDESLDRDQLKLYISSLEETMTDEMNRIVDEVREGKEIGK